VAEKRKVLSSVFNAEDAEYIKKIKDDLLSHTGKKYSDNELIKLLLQFYMDNMDVTWFDAITKKPLGAPKKLKGKPGRPKDTGVS
tara:strand:+ start:105 stop:359 length:255 start_codon:yes stop_codon:yes gene_type:complete